MKERPINMRPDEVRAILAGRKTQFRRVMRTQPRLVGDGVPYGDRELTGLPSCPYGAPGDRLWVRECWRPTFEPETGFTGISFFAGGMPQDDRRAGDLLDGRDRWRSSVHMPRWACRIILEVASVKVERLNEISEEDAKAEGVIESELGRAASEALQTYKQQRVAPVVLQFAELWQSDNGSESWDENPWVWAVEFRRLEVPND